MAVALFALLALPATARAIDFTQFQNAREAYNSLNYELAAELFTGLLATAAPEDKGPLVRESRKYLAGSYLFLGRKQEGEAQFELLLKAVPDYRLDPVTFPAEVQETFKQVRARLAEEKRKAEEAAAAAAAESDAAREERLKRDRERLQRLISLAKTERVERKRSRVLAMMPFGIGQFQNGDDGLGLVLAVTEGTLLAAGVTTFFLHQALPERPQIQDADDVETLEAVYRWSNNISMALLAIVAVTGVIDAQLMFKESTSEDRRREIPKELEEIELGVDVGPGGIQLRGRF